MKLYKLQHLPTGMFYTPSKGSGNLSKKGKVYVDIIPKVEWASTIRLKFYTERLSERNKLISDYFNIDVSKWHVDVYRKTNPEDWAIIEIT